MAKFKADATVLDEHATVHDRIAQFYRQVAYDLETHGSAVVQEFQRTTYNDDDAAHYQQWLNFDQLRQQADLHGQKAQYFRDLAQAVRTAEQNLT